MFNLESAVSKYSSSNSIPIYPLFNIFAARQAVPLPIVGSHTTSFSFVYVFIKYSERATGLNKIVKDAKGGISAL